LILYAENAPGGAGIEWAFAPNWSAKVEYNYLRLDDRTFTVPAGSSFLAGDTFTQSNRNIQMVRWGSTTGSIGAATATDSPVAGDAIVDVDEGRSPTLEIGQLEAKSFGDCVAQAISDGIV
jgi:hypothetical protein